MDTGYRALGTTFGNASTDICDDGMGHILPANLFLTQDLRPEKEGKTFKLAFA